MFHGMRSWLLISIVGSIHGRLSEKFSRIDSPMTQQKILDPQKINTAILNGYRLIKKILPQKLAENKIEPQHFTDFLLENVQIMRVKVPKDTDLNHYFEIMNNRGEQLEKHEVLKSRMMEALKDDKESQNCLHMVWEVCANMGKYVQMGLSPKQRDAIFGTKDWNRSTYVKGILVRSTKDRPGITETNVKTAQQIYNDHIKPFHGSKKIDEITVQDCELLLQWVKEYKNAEGKTVKKPTNQPTTGNQYIPPCSENMSES